MNPRTSPAYGSGTLALWWHGLRDRLRGDHARANARWGHVRPPTGSGKLIWIKAGASRDSVRVAVELLRALRERRLDVRLVLTFEEDYPDLLETRLNGLQKVGLGYGPCAARAAVRRTLARLQPLGIICVDHAPGGALYSEAQARGVHVIDYLVPEASDGNAVEAAYPLDAAQATAWSAVKGVHVARPADPLAQLVEAQVEPTFRVLVSGGAEPLLGWAHLQPAQFPALVAAWRRWPQQAESILFVSWAGAGALPELRREAPPTLRISDWQREPIGPGSLVLIDEPRWAPALAVSVQAIWLAGPDRYIRWQAMAGGVPLAFAAPELQPPECPAELPIEQTPEGFLARWSGTLTDPMGARRLGDVARRRVWEERRRSAQTVEDLLQRVYAW